MRFAHCHWPALLCRDALMAPSCVAPGVPPQWHTESEAAWDEPATDNLALVSAVAVPKSAAGARICTSGDAVLVAGDRGLAAVQWDSDGASHATVLSDMPLIDVAAARAGRDWMALALTSDGRNVVCQLTSGASDPCVLLERRPGTPRIAQVATPSEWDGRLSLLSAYDVVLCAGADTGACVQRVVHRYDAPTCCVRWSPHDGGQLFAVGGEQGLDIVDTRCRRPVLHADGMHMAEWSPFVPYWLAVSDGCAVGLFDLRGGAVVRRVPLPETHAMAWSNANADLLLAAGASNTLSAVSFLLGREIGRSESRDVGDVVQLAALPGRCHAFVGATLSGGLARAVLDAAALGAHAPCVRATDAASRAIEAALYARDMDAVHSLLLGHASSVLCDARASTDRVSDDARTETLHALLDAATPMPAVCPASWAVLSLPDDAPQLAEDILRYATGVPPRLEMGGNADSRAGVERVRLRVQLEHLLAQGDTAGMMALLPRISSALATAPGAFVPAETACRLIHTVQTESRAAALAMARQMLACVAVEGPGVSSRVARLLRTALHPTIFDVGADARSSPTSLSALPSSFTVRSGDCTPPVSPCATVSHRPSLPDMRRLSMGSQKTAAAAQAAWCATSDDVRAVRAAVRTYDAAVRMLDLEIALAQTHDRAAREQLLLDAAVSRGASLVSVASSTVLETLAALHARGEVRAYFRTAGRVLAHAPPASACTRRVSAHLQGDALSAAACAAEHAVSTARPSLVVRAVYVHAAMADGLRPLPAGLAPLVADRLRRLAAAMPVGAVCAGAQGYAALGVFLRGLEIPAGGPDVAVWREIAALCDLVRVHDSPHE